MSSPSKRIAPAVGVSCSRISLEVVVLPQPDSPMTPRVSPVSTAKSMPSTALTQPIRRRGKTAVVTGKCLVRSSTSNSGGDMKVLFGLRVLRRGAPAPRRPPGSDPQLDGLLAGAAGHCVGAARVKSAARGQRSEVRRLAGDRVKRLLAAELRHRAQEAPGVGVLRGVEQFAHGAGLDDLAGIHDRQL